MNLFSFHISIFADREISVSFSSFSSLQLTFYPLYTLFIREDKDDIYRMLITICILPLDGVVCGATVVVTASPPPRLSAHVLPIYGGTQLHENPPWLLDCTHVPPFKQGLEAHGSPPPTERSRKNNI